MPVEKLPKELNELIEYRKVLDKIARETGFSVAEIAILSVVLKESITCSILGVDSAAELQKNALTLERMDEFQKIQSSICFPDVQNKKILDPRTWTSL